MSLQCSLWGTTLHYARDESLRFPWIIVIDLTSDASTSQWELMAVTKQAYILVVGELCHAVLFHPTQIPGLPVFLGQRRANWTWPICGSAPAAITVD